MNLANRITLARIIAMPVVVFFQLVPWHALDGHVGGFALTDRDLITTVLFLLATASDGIDGYLARKYHMITNFGKFLDPLADKVLVCASLIGLMAVSRVAAWIVIVVVTREFAVTGLRLVAADDGIVIAAGSLGKWKTRLQMIGIIALLLNNFPFSLWHFPFATIMIDLAALMTVISGVDYFVRNWKVIDYSR